MTRGANVAMGAMVADWFCGKCGTANDDDDGFCISCGAARKRRREGSSAPTEKALAILPAASETLSEAPRRERQLKRRARAAKASKHEAEADLLRVATLEAANRLVRPRQSTNALLALLCSIGGILSAFVIEWAALVPIVLGLVLGRVAIKEIDASEGQLAGRAGASVAVWIGYGVLALLSLGIALLAAGAIK